MVPNTFPFDLSDIFKEVYWVDEYIGETPSPPSKPGTSYTIDDIPSMPYPAVDFVGRNTLQTRYKNDFTSYLNLLVDSNLGYVKMPKSGFLAYEHRLPIKMFKAVKFKTTEGYVLWDDVKSQLTNQAIEANAINAFRSRPAYDLERDQWGNAYLQTSIFFQEVFETTKINLFDYAWMGQYSKKNIPCGQGIFVWKTITDGIMSVLTNYSDRIAATFNHYLISLNGLVSIDQVTLYYDPETDRWQHLNGSNVTGYYEHPELHPKSQGSLLEENYVFLINNGNRTTNKMYIPVEVNIYLLKETGNWVAAKKMTHFGQDTFEGAGYKIGGILVTEPCLEARNINRYYVHETNSEWVTWGFDAKFWNFDEGNKTTVAVVERTIPTISR